MFGVSQASLVEGVRRRHWQREDQKDGSGLHYLVVVGEINVCDQAARLACSILALWIKEICFSHWLEA